MSDETKNKEICREQVVAGLDIGTTKIVCIAGYLNEQGKLEILGWGQAKSCGVRRGEVSNIQLTIESIKEAVSAAEAQCGFRIDSVYVGIACENVKSITHRGSRFIDKNQDFITEEDVNALKADMAKLNVDEGWSIISVTPQEYSVDTIHGIKNPVGHKGVRLEADFHIVQAHVKSINNIVLSVERAGLQVAGLDLEPLASSESVLSPDEKEAGVVLVDMGGGTTDVAIFYDGILRHTAVIPFGGNVITADIREGLSILERDAEQLKIKYGSALFTNPKEEFVISIPGIKGRPPKHIYYSSLSHIIHARLEEIFSFVEYEILNSGYKEKLAAGAVLTGGGSLMKNIKLLFSHQTGLDVRIGEPNEYLNTNAPEQLNSPIYATSVGLVLRGIQNSRQIRKIETEEKIEQEEEIISADDSHALSEEEVLQDNEENAPITNTFGSSDSTQVPQKSSKNWRWVEKLLNMILEK